eukprot:TRINITY_DN29729_c0_g1_i2.p1 TRINITY_DN29729_c0_g1~~TRINITY_DN29729_c0_g1_i2.p1  ORF type:complete len:128 (+),score=11.69 TRINITY_DN29729_c0_g1_i2:134-517(+)
MCIRDSRHPHRHSHPHRHPQVPEMVGVASSVIVGKLERVTTVADLVISVVLLLSVQCCWLTPQCSVLLAYSSVFSVVGFLIIVFGLLLSAFGFLLSTVGLPQLNQVAIKDWDWTVHQSRCGSGSESG